MSVKLKKLFLHGGTISFLIGFFSTFYGTADIDKR